MTPVMDAAEILKLYDEAVAAGGSADHVVVTTVRKALAARERSMAQYKTTRIAALEDAIAAVWRGGYSDLFRSSVEGKIRVLIDETRKAP